MYIYMQNSVCIFFTILLSFSVQQCKIPKDFSGDWYSKEVGKDVVTVVSANKWGEMTCESIYVHNNTYRVAGTNVTMLMKKVKHDDK